MAGNNMLRIAACSYEGSIFGWNVVEDESKEGLQLPMSFGFNCSQGSLKTLAVSQGGRYLCTGGTDERIRIFNVAENRSMGELGLHEGAITALEFFGDSHMISGAEDMMLRIWRCHDWECVHVLSGHKEPITSVSIHPSGKLALSVSKDNTMKLWNLVQGRCSFTRRLRGAADKVVWHPSGDYYMLTVQTEVQIYRAADNACLASLKHKSRVNSAVFTLCGCEAASSEASSVSAYTRVACVCEDKTLIFYDFEGKQTALLDVTGLDGRPRDMWSSQLAPTDVSATDAEGSISSMLAEEGDCLSIVTSLGRVSVISCRSLEAGNTLEECTLVSTQVKMEPRLTAVVAWSIASVKTVTATEMATEKRPVSKKRPRDSSSAAVDIASDKAADIAATAAATLQKKINASRASSSSDKKAKKEGKKPDQSKEKGAGKGKEESKGGKGRDKSKSPGRKKVSFGGKGSPSLGKGKGKDDKKSEGSGAASAPSPKTKSNVYYKKR